MSSSSGSNNNKLKILLFGSVGDNIDAFLSKLNRLHQSKAGPFDAAFCVGLLNASALLQKLQKQQDDGATSSLPMKVFLQEPLQEIEQLVSSNNKQQKQEGTKGKEEEEEQSYPCLQLAPNLYVLRNPQPPYAVTVWSLPIVEKKPELVVAACPSRMRVNDNSSATKELEKALSHVSYTGCDLLLTTEWPQGIERVLPPNSSNREGQNKKALPLSFDVAHVALQARARYHVTPSSAATAGFVQSPPFAHLKATTNTAGAGGDDGTTLHVGRFLSLAPVSTEKKPPKFVHALGLQPFHSLSYFELQQQRPEKQQLQPCPFTDSSYQRDGGGGASAATGRGDHGRNVNDTSASGLSEASARRILAEEQSKYGSSGGSALVSQRWQQKRKRPNQNDQGDDDSVAVDPNNTTLFVHGLHHDVRGILQQQGSAQGDAELFKVFTDITGPETVLTIRRPVPPGQTSSFCFVEMKTHDQAKQIWQLRELEVQGVPLSVKWATAGNASSGGGANRREQHGPERKRTRLTEADARDSTTVYFQLAAPSSQSSAEENSSSTEAQQERFKAVTERLRKWMEETLETALAGDDVDESQPKVTAADEPALQVQLRLVDSPSSSEQNQAQGGENSSATPQQQQHQHRQRNYGFLEFASHAAASMALATLTGSTDGGIVLDDAPGMPTTVSSDSNKDGDDTTNKGEDKQDDDTSSSVFQGLRLHWGHAKKPEDKKKRANIMIEDAETGFKFERKHFPADGRTDCWFCLASESCEKHLITGVHDACYSAMPRGPMHNGHVLLIPVQHSSQGVLKNPRVAEEMEGLKKQLRRHAAQEYDGSDLFVFERAIQTRGGYHTHVQCVPIPSGLGIQLQATMMAQARKIGMPLRELTSDLAVSAVLANNDDDDDDEGVSGGGGYFYAEIATRGGDVKRFLYQESASSSTSEGRSGRVTVPLQFGREVLAAVLRKPELAHWKSCLVDPEKEAALAAEFRKSFSEIK